MTSRVPVTDPGVRTASRLRGRYREHRESLFSFLGRPDVPPTNHASEQDLRPSVIHREVSGGYRSQRGADISAILTSLLTTARGRRRMLASSGRPCPHLARTGSAAPRAGPA